MWAWNGFWRLSNARPVGFNGPLRIPLTEVDAYASLHGFEYAKRIDFLHFIEQMDAKYMEHIAELQRKEEAKRNSKDKGRSRRQR